MIGRVGRAMLRLVAGALVVLAAFSALLIWRTAEEPLSVGFLLPVLKPYLAVLPPELSLEIEDIVIAWDGPDRSIDLRVTEVAIRARDGPVLVRFPAVDVGISARALVHGVVALTAVEIKKPSVVVSRHRDGTLTIAGAELDLDHDGEGLDAVAAVRAVAEDMLASEDPSRPLSYLREVRVSGGSATVKDAVLGADWHLPVVDLSLQGGPAGLAGRGALHVALGDAVARVDAAVSYANLVSADPAEVDSRGAISVAASFADVRPGSFAGLLSGIDPALAELVAVDVPLRGTITADIDPTASVVRPTVAFRIEGSAGVVSHPRFSAPVPVRGLKAEGRLDARRARLELERATMTLGSAAAPGPTLGLSGAAQERDDARIFAGTVTLRHLAMEESGLYWPEGLAEGARKWVTRNITGGSLDTLAAEFSIRAPNDDSEKIEIQRSDGTLSYHGLDVQYLREVPAVVGLDGTAVFDRTALRLKAVEGASQNLRVQDVAIDITGLDEREQTAVVDLGIEGAVRDAMDLLDYPRFDLVSKLGIAPADTGGSFAGRLMVSVPLIADVTFDDIGLHFAASIDEASIRDIRPGFNAGNGQLDLDVDTSRLHVAGPIQINGVPIDLDWTEAFTADSPFASKARITAVDVDAAARSALGIELDPYVRGPLSVVIDATFAPGGDGTINAIADLAAAELALPFLRWRKEAGAGGDAEAVIAVDKNRPTRLTSVRLDAGSLSAEGRGAFDPVSEASAGDGWLDLDRLVFAGSALSAVSVQWTADDLAVEIGGGTLDAAPFVAQGEAEMDADGLPLAGSFSLSAANLRQVTFADGRFLENVQVRLHRSSQGWEHVDLKALVPSQLASAHGDVAAGPQSFTFRYGPRGVGGEYPLLARISDAGGLLRALDAVDGIKGGYCEIVGSSDGAAADYPTRASLSCQRITDTEASPMGKILNALSISGIRQALAGEGITFDQARGDVVWHKGTATVVSAEANNNGLGVTFEGRLAIDPHHIDARGTVLPAYTVNRLIGRIPLIGGLFHEGQGFLAAHFRVTGRLADPKITAQPIKSITPSILVRFQNLFRDTPEPAPDLGLGPGAFVPDTAPAPATR
jgi:hypothetical protein